MDEGELQDERKQEDRTQKEAAVGRKHEYCA